MELNWTQIYCQIYSFELNVWKNVFIENEPVFLSLEENTKLYFFTFFSCNRMLSFILLIYLFIYVDKLLQNIRNVNIIVATAYLAQQWKRSSAVPASHTIS